MSHKAYAFDWQAFEQDRLLGILVEALRTDETSLLIEYVEAYQGSLRDPYEGEPLCEDWLLMTESWDVHQYGDFALTRFYNPSQDFGIAGDWLEIDALLTKQQRNALLGFPIGYKDKVFDPGRMGSYFQTPEQVSRSLIALSRLNIPEVQPFQGLLQACQQENLGLYVTF
jgi:hypothetical protein